MSTSPRPKKSSRRLVSVALGVVSLLSSLAFASATFASEPGEAEGANVTVARDLLANAKALLALGRAEDARKMLVISIARHPVPEAYVTLGDCQEKLGDDLAAWSIFVRLSHEARASGDVPTAELAERRFAEIDKRLVRLKVKGDARDLEATILVDGHPLEHGEVGVPLPLNRGAHTVLTRAAGKRDFTVRVELDRPGESREVVLPALVQIPARPAGPPNADVLRAKAPSANDRAAVRPLLICSLGMSQVTAVFYLVANHDHRFVAPTVLSGLTAVGLFAAAIIDASRPKSEEPSSLDHVRPFTVKISPTIDVATEGPARGATFGVRGTF